MKDSLKKQLIEALKDQKEIFGDELYEEKYLSRKTKVIIEPMNKPIINKSTVLKTKPQDGSNIQTEAPKLVYEKIKKDKKEDILFNSPKDDWEIADNLDDLYNRICNCQKCPLGATRNKFVSRASMSL